MRSSDGEFDPVELAAGDWLARRDFGLSPGEEAELAQWLRANPRHGEVFRELEKASGILDRWPEIARADAGTLASSSSPATSLPPTRGRRHLIIGLAAAAAIALTAGLIDRRHATGNLPTEVIVTDVGALRSLALPDGSTLQLNTDTEIETAFSRNERRVRLKRGEANFIVAKDPARPFIVETGGISVRAVGTAFNVRLRGAAVDVLVTEGKVRVDNAIDGATLLAPLPRPVGDQGTEILSAGQRVVVTLVGVSRERPAVPTLVVPAQIEQSLAWQERRLKFDGNPLSEVVAEFNRYNRHKLVIEDSSLAAQKFGGTFQLDGYATLIALLEQSFDAIAERRENSTIIRRRH